MAKFKVLHGPPCSGKSTYAKANKGSRDIIVDYDRISTALTYIDEHSLKDREFAHRYVNACRGSVVSCVREDQGDADAVWYLVTNITDALRASFDGTDPEYIEMDITEEECLARLEKDDTRPDKEEWAEKIKKWFEDNKSQQDETEDENRMATPSNKERFKDSAQQRAVLLSPVLTGEKRIDSARYVEGYAANYETYLLYDDGEWGKTYERFEPGCFSTTDMTDVIMQFDHAGRIFSRTKNGTLIVEPDNKGLFMAADLDKTDLARGLYEDIHAGMITKMSWRFKVGTYRIERTEGSRDCTIVHTAIPKIYDVSAVSIPANDNTEINARDFVSGVRDEIARREAELDDKRRKLKIKIKISEERK